MIAYIYEVRYLHLWLAIIAELTGFLKGISRFFFPAPDAFVDAGHMGYLGDPELARHCRAFIAAVASAA